MLKLTNNFNLNEFDSKDGAEMPAEVLSNIKKLSKELQQLRDYIGCSITINSGYRSPEHNKSIGGAKNSQHVKGNAADIVVKGLKPDEVYNILEDLISQGLINIDGIGRYDTFTHVDIRGYKARWDNRKNI